MRGQKLKKRDKINFAMGIAVGIGLGFNLSVLIHAFVRDFFKP